jgi:molybdopterin-guanine dinucleotide biosynthesis protein A
MQNQFPNLRDVTLTFLAGGEGSRMGKPKGFLQVAGQPILTYLLNQFAWPGPTLLVTSPGREKPDGSERFGREVIDPMAGEGPLRGMLTALDACQTPLLFLATVDMPNVKAVQANRMIERLSSESLGVMCRHNGRLEPFPLLLRMSIAPQIHARFAAGERSVQKLADLLEVLDPNWPPNIWTNLNHPDEFAAWAATVSASPPARR